MDLKNNDLIENINKENNFEENIYFYIMTLQIGGVNHQIKIFENSNASEIAFNFCKTYNLDFSSMKYIKRCIKQIIFYFNSTKRNEMINILKSNIQFKKLPKKK